MSYFTTCGYCGANLDPGEPCDCQRGMSEEQYDELIDREHEDHIDNILFSKEDDYE